MAAADWVFFLSRAVMLGAVVVVLVLLMVGACTLVWLVLGRPHLGWNEDDDE